MASDCNTKRQNSDCPAVFYLSEPYGKGKYMCNLVGKKFGKLTVLELISKSPRIIKGKQLGYKYIYRCQCDCGKIVNISKQCLLKGTKSCGCLRVEKAKNNKTHGLRNTRLYHTWCLMKQRCYNPNSNRYNTYGGKGIKICDEWLHDFKSFYDWALLNDYKDNLTIDRINNNGNYEPNNCHWVDYKTQANNRRTNRKITYKGRTENIIKWAELKGLDYSALLWRLNNNWGIEKALNTPSQRKNNDKQCM